MWNLGGILITTWKSKSDRVKYHWRCLFTPRRPVVTWGYSFWGRMALKLVVTTLVCVKLVINLWRFAPPDNSHCKNPPVYAMGGYNRSLKSDVNLFSMQHSALLWAADVLRHFGMARVNKDHTVLPAAHKWNEPLNDNCQYFTLILLISLSLDFL